MKPKYDKKAHAKAARIIGRKRSYGSLKRVTAPHGFNESKNICQKEMLTLHMMSTETMNILIGNAYRLGFKVGRASRVKEYGATSTKP